MVNIKQIQQLPKLLKPVQFTAELNYTGKTYTLPPIESLTSLLQDVLPGYREITLIGSEMPLELWLQLQALPQRLLNATLTITGEKLKFTASINQLAGHMQRDATIFYLHELGIATLVKPTPEQRAEQKWRLVARNLPSPNFSELMAAFSGRK